MFAGKGGCHPFLNVCSTRLNPVDCFDCRLLNPGCSPLLLSATTFVSGSIFNTSIKCKHPHNLGTKRLSSRPTMSKPTIITLNGAKFSVKAQVRISYIAEHKMQSFGPMSPHCILYMVTSLHIVHSLGTIQKHCCICCGL